MSKWYVDNLNIHEYEKDEVVSKNLVENSKDEIEDLNWRINCLKIEKRKSQKGYEEIWKEKMNKSQRRRKRSD